MSATSAEHKRSRWQWLKDAFSLDAGYEPLTEPQYALLDRVAAFIVRRRMTVPAIFVLESSKPMNYVGSQAMAFFEPLVHTLFTAPEYTELRLILERRTAIETLLRKIEDLEAARGEPLEADREKDPDPS